MSNLKIFQDQKLFLDQVIMLKKGGFSVPSMTYMYM